MKRINECCGLLKRLINTASRTATPTGAEITPVTFTALKDRRRREDSKKVCLAPEELMAMERAELSPVEDSYRRLFLLQTECGVRASDLPTVISRTLAEGSECLTITTVKEGIDATIFISPRLRGIINGLRTGTGTMPKFGPGFNSTYNRAIKSMARKAGLERVITWKEQRGRRLLTFSAPLCEVISSHFARHTFITTRVREGWRTDTLRLLTGHTDDTMIKRVYTHLTDTDRQNMVMTEYHRLGFGCERITDSRTGLHTPPPYGSATGIY